MALQTIAEIVPLLVLGGATGVASAFVALSWFIPLAPLGLPRVENIAINGPVLIVSSIFLALAGLIAALLPAAQAWRSDLMGASREDHCASAGSMRQARVRNILVVAQIALAVPLVTAGALLTRTFNTLTAIDPGFDATDVLTVHLAIPRSNYRDDKAVARVVGRYAERAAALPGVTAAGLVSRLPLAGGVATITMEFDASQQLQEQIPSVDARTITPGYFKAMGIPLLEGRNFDARDHLDAPVVGIIDERIARLLWPGQSAVGKRMRIPAVLTNNVPQPWMEIVGVVGHVIHDGIDRDTRPQVYWNNDQRAQDRMVLVVRTAGNPAALAPMIRQAVRDVDPQQPVYDVRTMQQVVERSLGQRRLSMILLVVFGLAALLLSAIGVYGVIAFGVERQRRELGIRLALGATRMAVTRAVVKRGVVLAVIGIAIGLTLAAIVTRGMQSLLFGVAASDASSFAAAILALLAIALVASYLPARRAAAVDPSLTLRAE